MKEQNKNIVSDQSGQALLEFILLLAVVAIVSFGMVGIVNRGLSSYWRFFVTLIVDDPSINIDF
jgi:Flp pilus assembly pilin Flp